MASKIYIIQHELTNWLNCGNLYVLDELRQSKPNQFFMATYDCNFHFRALPKGIDS